MQKAMIEKDGEWITGYCDFFAKQVGEVFADASGTSRIVISVEKVSDPQGRNWFHTLRNATDDETAAEPVKEKSDFGSFLEMFADSK